MFTFDIYNKKIYDILNLSEIYEQIVVGFDFDSVFGGTLLAKKINRPVIFFNSSIQKNLIYMICIRLPPFALLTAYACLIIDNRDIRPNLSSNTAIIDQSYQTVTELIADYFEIKIPSPISDILKKEKKLILHTSQSRNVLDRIIYYIQHESWEAFSKFFKKIKKHILITEK